MVKWPVKRRVHKRGGHLSIKYQWFLLLPEFYFIFLKNVLFDRFYLISSFWIRCLNIELCCCCYHSNKAINFMDRCEATSFLYTSFNGIIIEKKYLFLIIDFNTLLNISDWSFKIDTFTFSLRTHSTSVWLIKEKEWIW